MLIRRAPDLRSSEITDERLYLQTPRVPARRRPCRPWRPMAGLPGLDRAASAQDALPNVRK